jgi:sulfatase modifying factor 1
MSSHKFSRIGFDLVGTCAAVAVGILTIIPVCEHVLGATPIGTVSAADQGKTMVNPRDGLTYVRIQAGSFQMGCSIGDTECSPEENPRHEVMITRDFWIGQTLATQAAYKHVIGADPSNFKGDQRPVEQVSWDEALAYCKDVGMRLPTEAEYEYAARGGNPAARYGPIGQIAWYVDNTSAMTHDVAQKEPNGYGLYDMLGHLWEWVGDWYDDHYYEHSPSKDPPGPANGVYRVLRGGSWIHFARTIRVSNRLKGEAGIKSYNFGFRCAGEVDKH